MIYYPLTTLMLAGIRDILIISTPQDLPRFERAARRRRAVGPAHLSTPCSRSPSGLAQAFIIGRDFVGNDPVAPDPRRQHLLRPRLAASVLQRAARQDRRAPRSSATTCRIPSATAWWSSTPTAARSSHRGEAAAAEVATTPSPASTSTTTRCSTSRRPRSRRARGELEITDVNREYLRARAARRGAAWAAATPGSTPARTSR